MDRLDILIAMNDNALTAELVKQLKAGLMTDRLEVEFAIAMDGKRALSDFRAIRPAIVLAGADLPGMDGVRLAREIAKISGETSTFVFGHAPSDPVYEVIQLPIVNWKQTLQRLRAALPEDLKSRLGIDDRDAQLIDALTQYGKKYSAAFAETHQSAGSSLVMIPAFAAPGDPASEALRPSKEETAVAMTERPATSKTNSMAQSATTAKSYFDIILVVALIIAAGCLQIWPDSDRVMSIKNIVYVLAALAVLGVTLGRALERLSRSFELNARQK